MEPEEGSVEAQNNILLIKLYIGLLEIKIMVCQNSSSEIQGQLVGKKQIIKTG